LEGSLSLGEIGPPNGKNESSMHSAALNSTHPEHKEVFLTKVAKGLLCLKECDSGYSKGTCTAMFILHYLQYSSYGTRLGAHQLDEWIKCGVYTQWSVTQP
jgi:hypothetical protein